ncbi:DUF1015 family protein [Nocardioides sp. CER19]|uniref:DUF1015 family protein n=1 Tax=Nocardioides sp. CER19 TaxID=3038538 RepID=UPI00244AFD42|nr:DUF1015 family protein [Nocardioides sp. CER19]MDH2415563.1 DUF1015 family protein [Nocardioides sp. CER19]
MDASDVVSPPYLAGPLSLHPFRARLLQPSRIGDPASGRLFARPFRSVATRLQQWEERGRISTDPHAALYVHEYTTGDRTVRGIVGTLELARRATSRADSVVLPHEGIHPAQADELADRMEEMQLNPAPILLVHRASGTLREHVARLVGSPPARQFEDAGGQRHRLWAIRDADEAAPIIEALSGARALIADGHHRYAAYLRMQARRPGTAADAGLAMLVDHGDTPLQLRAIHRTLAGVRLDDALAAFSTLGIVIEFRPVTTAADLDPATVAVTDGRRWAIAHIPARPGTMVEFVHEVLLPALPRGPRAVGHHPDSEEAVAAARRRHGTALLLPPPTFEQVLDAAQAGRLLPEKATSFQPKPHVGVIMRSMRDG